jgi:hypothetical protein
MNKRTFQVAALVASLAFAAPVAASPVPMAPLAASSAKELEAVVAKARAARPESFRAVAKLREDLPAMARKARAGKVNVRALLVAEGPRALPAILAELQEGPEPTPGGRLAPIARAWAIGLLEAAGHWRDPSAIAVIEAAAAHPSAEPEVVAAAARALGAIGTDDAERRLEALFEGQPQKRRALAPAMGACRRVAMGRFLAKALESASTDEAPAVVEGLGQVASAWPWQTPELVKRGEGNDTRRVAFEALLGRYARAEGALRSGIVDALWLVDWPEGSALARARAEREPASKAAYLELAQKLEKSPLRR